MRHFALQTLTWGTIVGSSACALWLASKDSMSSGSASFRSPALTSAAPAARAGALPSTAQAPVVQAAPPGALRTEPRPVVLLEVGQPLRR
jgi:hypothetical protein